MASLICKEYDKVVPCLTTRSFTRGLLMLDRNPQSRWHSSASMKFGLHNPHDTHMPEALFILSPTVFEGYFG